MKPVFRYTGSKWSIAPWVISHFPAHTSYIEPFGGSAGVLLRKTPAKTEIYNDLFGECVNVFRILRDREQTAELERLINLTPYSREEYYEAFNVDETAPPVEKARRFLVRCGMGFGSIGGTRKSPTGWAAADDRCKSWASKYLPAEFAEWAARLKAVQIEQRDAMQIIDTYDADGALIYCDPPYMAEQWSDAKTVYQNIGINHDELLQRLKGCKAYVVISGYASELYAETLKDWTVKTKTAYTARASAGARTECLWLSPKTEAALNDRQLKIEET